MKSSLKKTARQPATKTLRPSKYDLLVTSIRQNHSHLSTYEIQCRRSAIESDLGRAELEIKRLSSERRKIHQRLSSEMATMRERRAEALAILDGLAAAIQVR